MPPTWTTQVQAGARSSKRSCYHAEIFRDGLSVCRVTIAGASATHEAATEALAVRAREWISGFERRGLLSGLMGASPRGSS